MDDSSDQVPPNALGFDFCGEELGGRYRLGQRLGFGAMASIYLATDRRTGGHVAVKVLHPTHEDEPLEVKRFLQEGQLGAQIRHPNLVPVFDFSGIGGRHFIVMELVDGQNLTMRLKTGRFDWQRSARLVLDLLAALQALHDRGILHRDISPTNCLIEMVDGQERARLTDLGYARKIEEQDLALTEVPTSIPGSEFGVPGYRAPECVRGRHHDVRSDIYGIGALWYTMLTGEAPWLVNPDDDDAAPPPPDKLSMPPALRVVLCGALDVRTRRHHSAASMAAAVRAALDASAHRSRPIHARLVAPVLGLLLVLQGASTPWPAAAECSIDPTLNPEPAEVDPPQATVPAEPVAIPQQAPAALPQPSPPTVLAKVSTTVNAGGNAPSSSGPAVPSVTHPRKKSLRSALAGCKPDGSELEVELEPGQAVEVNGGPPFGDVGRCVMHEIAKYPAPSRKLTLTL